MGAVTRWILTAAAFLVPAFVMGGHNIFTILGVGCLFIAAIIGTYRWDTTDA